VDLREQGCQFLLNIITLSNFVALNVKKQFDFPVVNVKKKVMSFAICVVKSDDFWCGSGSSLKKLSASTQAPTIFSIYCTHYI
jgi:hypothetical protein